MNQITGDSQTDEWSEWLLHQRHGNNPDFEKLVRVAITQIADRVLNAAKLTTGMTVGDIGAGDGLIAFNAIERIGKSLNVIFTDISASMLQHAESLAKQRGVRDQCTFHLCSAEKLDEIPDGSVDVVMTRAVLAYVTDKTAALREFYRVLKPGGRVSIGEPILRDEAFEAVAIKKVLDSQRPGSQDRFLSIVHRWKAAQFPDTEEKIAQSPIANYTERDLIRFAQIAGFTEIHMEFHIDIYKSIMNSWDIFLDSSPHPWAPTVGRILIEQCTAEEQKLFEDTVRPIIEGSNFRSIDRIAYLTAEKCAG